VKDEKRGKGRKALKNVKLVQEKGRSVRPKIQNPDGKTQSRRIWAGG